MAGMPGCSVSSMLMGVGDIHLGDGSLAGRGIYAGRLFDEGEVVLTYELQRLSRDQYVALADVERLFVHSYLGERWLYPPPARYVNHADIPNTWQDFERRCHIAVRHIEPGDLLTTDARKETDRELATFLSAYERAVGTGGDHQLHDLIDAEAVGWVERRGRTNRAGIVAALRDGAESGRLVVRDPRWIIGTGRWEAVCSYECETHGAGSSAGRSTGYATDVLKVIDGNWQLVYRHESRA